MPSKTIAYLHVSTGGQDLDHQKLAILEYARRHRTPVADFVAVHGVAGSRAQREQLLGLIDTLQPGDRVIVSELSRLGRSLPQILQIVERFIHKGIRLIALKESIRFEGKHNVQTKAMIALFGLFAEVERDLMAERTKEGLAAAKANGTRVGRPKGMGNLRQQARRFSAWRWDPLTVQPCKRLFHAGRPRVLSPAWGCWLQEEVVALGCYCHQAKPPSKRFILGQRDGFGRHVFG